MRRFQSPSRWGRCCIDGNGSRSRTGGDVSVPFSMGTVLHPLRGEGRPLVLVRFSPLLDGDGVASCKCPARSASPAVFQSPSRWGRCCIGLGVTFLLIFFHRFSPLLDGDGVASATWSGKQSAISGFSPLLDGDGVASHAVYQCNAQSASFSPLLDGDGVASRSWGAHLSPRQKFQSPSRWGRCCIRNILFVEPIDHMFQSPSRWGRCCIPEPR